jgi:branched-chain amino acid aminotransferase
VQANGKTLRLPGGRGDRRSLSLWYNGEIRDIASTGIHPLAHGLHYGTGVFEGIRAYANPDGAAVFRLRDHLDRMQLGCEALGIRFSISEFEAATLAVLRANKHRDAYIRPLAIYARGGLGLDVEVLGEDALVASMPWKPHLGSERVRLTHSPFRRNTRLAIPPLKLCGAYVNSILAKREATSRGFGEALFTDVDGQVVECTGENVFMVKDGRITAVEHPDALPGITRATVIELAGAESRPVSLHELQDADEIFLTGTSAEIAQDGWLDARELGANPVSMELRRLYQSVVTGQETARNSWLTPY